MRGAIVFGLSALAVGFGAFMLTTGGAPQAVAAVQDDGAAEEGECVTCHMEVTPGITSHWKGSRHALRDVTCLGCHEAEESDLDAWEHEGEWIATIVTPKDCAQCHEREAEEFQNSHHAKAGNILHSLDNLLAEVVEGHRGDFEIPDPHTPGKTLVLKGMSFAASGCHQCHGSQLKLVATEGDPMTPWKVVVPEGGGKAKITYDAASVDRTKIARAENGRPLIDTATWPNTGIGRLNLDGSRGSCSACHSRHDFSARRARQPENCGRCHLGPDHPQKEIYEESKHGIAYRDKKDEMNLDSTKWVVGVDYAAAPTCATCHASATRNQPVTHDPRARIAWNNRPPASTRMDTDEHGAQVKPGGEIASPWQDKRAAMKDVCTTCHAPSYVDGFFAQYDDFVELYNGKFANPGKELMGALLKNDLRTKAMFDEKIEWTWFYLWHHEGRRARMGASMMAPDYAHWHGTFEVAERFYQEMVPEIRAIVEHAKTDAAKRDGAAAVEKLLNEILDRPEHRFGAGRGK